MKSGRVMDEWRVEGAGMKDELREERGGSGHEFVGTDLRSR